MNLGIGGRLLIAHLVLSMIVIGAVEAVLVPALRSDAARQLDSQLQRGAEAVASQLDRGQSPVDAVYPVARAAGLHLRVLGPGGEVLADSDPHFAAAAPVSRTVAATQGRQVEATGGPGPVDDAVETAHKAILLAAVIGLLVALLMGFAAARMADGAVGALTRAARRMADGDLAGPPVRRGPGELGDLAAALDKVAAQLSSQLERLTSERDLLEGVLSVMEEAVLVLRPDGSILQANPAARAVLSIPRMAHGRPLIETVRFPPLHDAVARATAGQPAGFELTFSGPPRRELLGRAAPLPRGGEAEVVIVLRDVTEIRRLEAIRRDFVASASHELRTPVAAIRGYAETLAAGALEDPATAVRFVAGLARQAERLSALIDDLLDLSRIESGGLRLLPEPTPVSEPLRRLVEAARSAAERKHIALSLFPVEEGVLARVDPRALDMIVGNLLDNALKYTPDGGKVSVSAAVAEGAVRIDVRDTGPGIEPRHINRIFERFYRVDAGRSREVGGTGLGLAIAKHAAQQSGGDVGVESTVGAGSRFWLRLPCSTQGETAASDEDSGDPVEQAGA